MRFEKTRRASPSLFRYVTHPDLSGNDGGSSVRLAEYVPDGNSRAAKPAVRLLRAGQSNYRGLSAMLLLQCGDEVE